MHFDMAMERGEYGAGEGEFFRVEAVSEDLDVIFHSAKEGSYDFFARRPVDMSNDDFLEEVYDDPEVYPSSEVTVCPDFPISEGPYQNVPLTFYAARTREERNSDAIVEVSLDENISDEKMRWVNLEQDPAIDEPSYSGEIWYIGPEPDLETITRYFSQEPLQEQEAEQLTGEMTQVLEECGPDF